MDTFQRMTGEPMTGDEFKAALKRLGYTQGAFGEFVATNIKSVNTWGRTGPPMTIVRLIEFMDLTAFPPAPPFPAGRSSHSGEQVAEALRPILAGIVRRAGDAGWSEHQIRDAIPRIDPASLDSDA